MSDDSFRLTLTRDEVAAAIRIDEEHAALRRRAADEGLSLDRLIDELASPEHKAAWAK